MEHLVLGKCSFLAGLLFEVVGVGLSLIIIFLILFVIRFFVFLILLILFFVLIRLFLRFLFIIFFYFLLKLLLGLCFSFLLCLSKVLTWHVGSPSFITSVGWCNLLLNSFNFFIGFLFLTNFSSFSRESFLSS